MFLVILKHLNLNAYAPMLQIEFVDKYQFVPKLKFYFKK